MATKEKYSGGLSVISYQPTVHQEADLNRYQQILPQVLKVFQ